VFTGTDTGSTRPVGLTPAQVRLLRALHADAARDGGLTHAQLLLIGIQNAAPPQRRRHLQRRSTAGSFRRFHLFQGVGSFVDRDAEGGFMTDGLMALTAIREQCLKPNSTRTVLDDSYLKLGAGLLSTG